MFSLFSNETKQTADTRSTTELTVVGLEDVFVRHGWVDHGRVAGGNDENKTRTTETKRLSRGENSRHF